MQNQIDTAFATLNAEMAARQMTWAKGRFDAIRALRNRADDGYEALRAIKPANREERYSKSAALAEYYLSVAGGKKWENILAGRTWEAAAEIVAKNTQALIDTRDARIINALTKAGITELPEFELTHTSDGFEGTFDVAGKTVTIRTILAGGYNIQCLHQRTLVKVK